MIVATILFVLSAGSAVLAGDMNCADPKTIPTIPVDLTKVAKEYFYCGSHVEGQTEALCSLDVTTKDANSADLTLKGKSTEKKISMTLEEGTNGTYTTTVMDDKSGVKLVTYITGASKDGKCMSYVKCFEGGMWYGSEKSGIFSAVVCTDKKDCDKKPAKEIMDKLKGLGKIKKC